MCIRDSLRPLDHKSDVLTITSSLFTVVHSDLPFGTNDKSSVKFKVILPMGSHVPSLNTAAVKYKWHLGDYEGMNTFLLDVNWYSVICFHPSAHDAWDAFKDILYAAVDSFIPHVPSSSLRIRHSGCNFRDLSNCTSRKRQLWHLLNCVLFKLLERVVVSKIYEHHVCCLLYTSPSPRDS